MSNPDEVGTIQPEADKPAGRTPADRAKEIGRDGAYLEVDVKDLLMSQRRNELPVASMVVLRCGRIELSDPLHVDRLQAIMKDVAESRDKDFAGMSDEQVGFAVFRKVFEMGMEALLQKRS